MNSIPWIFIVILLCPTFQYGEPTTVVAAADPIPVTEDAVHVPSDSASAPTNPLIRTIPIHVQTPTKDQHTTIDFPIYSTSYQSDTTAFCSTHALSSHDCETIHQHVQHIVREHDDSISAPSSSSSSSRSLLILGHPSSGITSTPTMTFPHTHIIHIGAPRISLHTLYHRLEKWMNDVGDGEMYIPYVVMWISPFSLTNSTSTSDDIVTQFVTLHNYITSHLHACVMVMSMSKVNDVEEEKRIDVNEKIKSFASTSTSTIYIDIDGILQTQIQEHISFWDKQGYYTPTAYHTINNILTQIIHERDQQIQYDEMKLRDTVARVMERPPHSYLHIGGQQRQQHPDWDIMDAMDAEWVNYVGDAGNMTRWIKPVFNTIYASHVVEHFDYNMELSHTLSEWYRILLPGGKIMISVPDMDIIARLYLDTSLPLSDRWLLMRMLFGGHINQWDYHKVGLNIDFLSEFLATSGFINITRVDLFETIVPWHDTSSHRFHDTLISLSVIAYKPV